MRELASFVSSGEGLVYARTNQMWGTDPAAWLEPLDDVLAYNFRVGLLTRLGSEDKDEPDEHQASIDRARKGAEDIKRRMNG